MASIRTVLELVNQQFMSAIKQSEDAVKNFKKSSEEAGNKFGDSFKSMSIASTALGAALLATSHQVMQFADEISDIATAHQEAISGVLGLAAALQANGGKAESVGRLFLEMSKNIDAANSGNLKTAQSFQNLGVSISDLGSLSESDIRGKLIKGIADIKDPAERAAKAFEMFGKAATGVDFIKLAQDLDEQTAKYAAHEDALKTAGDAYDKLGQIAMDIKVAFAEAFKPAFDAITKLNPSIDTLTTSFKILATAMTAIIAVSVINGLLKLREAFVLLNATMLRNPFIAAAAGLAAAAVYFGVLSDGSDVVNKLTNETDKNTDATDKNQKAKRDQSGLFVAQQKELDGLKKITEGFVRSNEQLQKKLDLELIALTQTEEQKRVTQQLAEIETNREKALIDLKNQYNSLDADGRARQKKAYDEQRAAIIANADLEMKAATQTITNIESQKRALADFLGSMDILRDGQEKILKIQQGMTPKNSREQMLADEQINANLQRRAIVLGKIKEMKLDDSLNLFGDAFLTDNVDKAREKWMKLKEEIAKSGDPALVAQMNQLTEAVGGQLSSVTMATNAVVKARESVMETQRSFSYGWEKAFKEYVDNATNAATTAETLFKKATSGMEDAIVNFAKTGKFEWKNFVNMMVEELLRSQIRSLMANLFTSGKAGGGGGGLFDSIISGAKSLFGFANGGPVQGNTPILVGEQGPEVFVPGSNGNIVPNNALGGSNVVTYNISAVDARSFQQLLARDPQFIHAVAEQGRLSLPQTRR